MLAWHRGIRCFSLCPLQLGGQGWARGWEATQLGQLTQTAQSDIPCQITSRLAIKPGGLPAAMLLSCLHNPFEICKLIGMFHCKNTFYRETTTLFLTTPLFFCFCTSSHPPPLRFSNIGADITGDDRYTMPFYDKKNNTQLFEPIPFR